MKESKRAEDLKEAKIFAVEISSLESGKEVKESSISSKLLWFLKIKWPEGVLEVLFLRKCSQHSVKVIKWQQERQSGVLKARLFQTKRLIVRFGAIRVVKTGVSPIKNHVLRLEKECLAWLDKALAVNKDEEFRKYI